MLEELAHWEAAAQLLSRASVCFPAWVYCPIQRPDRSEPFCGSSDGAMACPYLDLMGVGLRHRNDRHYRPYAQRVLAFWEAVASGHQCSRLRIGPPLVYAGPAVAVDMSWKIEAAAEMYGCLVMLVVVLHWVV